ncbi:hypothetical protein ACTFIU_011203 [Dictyostelium citrinum]
MKVFNLFKSRTGQSRFVPGYGTVSKVKASSLCLLRISLTWQSHGFDPKMCVPDYYFIQSVSIRCGQRFTGFSSRNAKSGDYVFIHADGTPLQVDDIRTFYILYILVPSRPP